MRVGKQIASFVNRYLADKVQVVPPLSYKQKNENVQMPVSTLRKLVVVCKKKLAQLKSKPRTNQVIQQYTKYLGKCRGISPRPSHPLSSFQRCSLCSPRAAARRKVPKSCSTRPSGATTTWSSTRSTTTKPSFPPPSPRPGETTSTCCPRTSTTSRGRSSPWSTPASRGSSCCGRA